MTNLHQEIDRSTPRRTRAQETSANRVADTRENKEADSYSKHEEPSSAFHYRNSSIDLERSARYIPPRSYSKEPRLADQGTELRSERETRSPILGNFVHKAAILCYCLANEYKPQTPQISLESYASPKNDNPGLSTAEKYSYRARSNEPVLSRRNEEVLLADQGITITHPSQIERYI